MGSFFSRKGSNLRQRRGGKYSDRRYQSEGGDDSAAESTDFSVPDLTKMPSVPEFFGYALCPGTVVFGPWVKYSDYFGIFVQPRWVSKSLLWMKLLSENRYFNKHNLSTSSISPKLCPLSLHQNGFLMQASFPIINVIFSKKQLSFRIKFLWYFYAI